MTFGGEKPSLEELAHFGVKGMKWGIRRVEQPANTNYTTRMRSDDRRDHGKRAVSRINRRMNEGLSREQALEREHIRNENQRLAAAGAVFVGSMLANHALSRIQLPTPDSTPGIGSTASKVPYAKSRRGVHNITTMK